MLRYYRPDDYAQRKARQDIPLAGLRLHRVSHLVTLNTASGAVHRLQFSKGATLEERSAKAEEFCHQVQDLQDELVALDLAEGKAQPETTWDAVSLRPTTLAAAFMGKSAVRKSPIELLTRAPVIAAEERTLVDLRFLVRSALERKRVGDETELTEHRELFRLADEADDVVRMVERCGVALVVLKQTLTASIADICRRRDAAVDSYKVMVATARRMVAQTTSSPAFELLHNLSGHQTTVQMDELLAALHATQCRLG